jgi:drug/metabolite transporter (DMT)-like permease
VKVQQPAALAGANYPEFVRSTLATGMRRHSGMIEVFCPAKPPTVHCIMQASDHALPHRPRWVAYLFLALSMSLAGSYVALSKLLVAVLPVFLLGWLRFGLAGLAMAHWLRRPFNEPPLTRETKKLLFLESFLGNFMFSICMLFGVSMTSAVSAGVIMASIPAVVALVSWLFLGERIGLRIWAAIFCGALGIAMLALSKTSAGSAVPAGIATAKSAGSQLLGNLLIFGSVLCEAAYAVIGKKLTGSLSPKRISALINLWGFVLMTPLGFWAAWHFNFSTVHPEVWLLLVFYAMAASVWTVWLWMTGLNTVPAAQAGVFTVLLPISAALVGVALLGEELSAGQLAAFVPALLGVLLATIPGRATQTTAAITPLG